MHQKSWEFWSREVTVGCFMFFLLDMVLDVESWNLLLIWLYVENTWHRQNFICTVSVFSDSQANTLLDYCTWTEKKKGNWSWKSREERKENKKNAKLSFPGANQLCNTNNRWSLFVFVVVPCGCLLNTPWWRMCSHVTARYRCLFFVLKELVRWFGFWPLVLYRWGFSLTECL